MKKIVVKIYLLLITSLVFLFPLSLSAAGLVPCGGPNESACSLCHLFVMAQGIWNYLSYILAIVAITMIIVSGLMYIVSGANEGLNKLAKEAMTKVAIGLVFVLGAWVMVNTIIYLLAVKGDGSSWNLQGNWYKLSCGATAGNNYTSGGSSEETPEPNVIEEKKVLNSIIIKDKNGESEAVSLKTANDSVDLKLFGVYSGNGQDSEKEITSPDIVWSTVDETLVKVINNQLVLLKECSDAAGCADKVTAKYNYEGKEYQDDMAVKINISGGACQLVAGSKDAEFNYVFSRLNIPKDNAGHRSSCEGNNYNWKNDSSWDGKREQVTAYLKSEYAGLDKNPQIQSRIGIYITDDILTSYSLSNINKNCPNRTLTGYVFVRNGDDGRAWANQADKVSSFCIDNLNVSAGKRNSFLHEAIGHVTADLTDEYIEKNKEDRTSKEDAPSVKQKIKSGYLCKGPNYNCTSDSTCKKWNNNDDCIPGCKLTENHGLYRSSQKSIMRSDREDIGFNELLNYIIIYRMDHYPNGPANLYEEFDFCPPK